MNDPEKLSSERIFDGKVFDVDRDRVRLPHGREVTVDVIRHPASAVIVPVPEPGHVILIRQYRYAVNQWLWELPAGSVGVNGRLLKPLEEDRYHVAVTPGQKLRSEVAAERMGSPIDTAPPR